MLKIFDDPDQWLRQNGKDLCSDNVAPVYPVSKWKDGESRIYFDEEEGVEKLCSWEDHIKL